MKKTKTKTKETLFLELAKPNKFGISRWVNVSEFVGKYKGLKFGNGGDWSRKESRLAKRYIIKFDKDKSKGNSIDRIKLDGIQNIKGNQSIKAEISKKIKKMRCVILDVSSNIETDHKNGRKQGKGGDPLAMNSKTQKLEHFQPLSKAANDAKRQHCKECTKTNIRFDAKKIGYKISYCKGTKKHNGKATGCVGCFWFDPKEFRKH